MQVAKQSQTQTVSCSISQKPFHWRMASVCIHLYSVMTALQVIKRLISAHVFDISSSDCGLESCLANTRIHTAEVVVIFSFTQSHAGGNTDTRPWHPWRHKQLAIRGWAEDAFLELNIAFISCYLPIILCLNPNKQTNHVQRIPFSKSFGETWCDITI